MEGPAEDMPPGACPLRPWASSRAGVPGSRFDGGNMADDSGKSTRSSIRPVTSERATTTSKTSRSISQ
jgi:hypothetical protein